MKRKLPTQDIVRTYPWRVAVMVAGRRSQVLGRKFLAISTETGRPWGPNPYRVISKRDYHDAI